MRPKALGSAFLLGAAILAGFHLAAADTAAPAYPVQAASGAPTYAVSRVLDGDTVVLDMAGTETTVRLIGVDTPETVHPSKPVEAFGKDASAFTSNLLAGERVSIEYQPGASRLDKHGRTLGYLYRVPDGLFVNLEIVRQGYGHAYVQYPFQHMEVFRRYETRAREAGKGLWGTPSGPPAPQKAASIPDPEPPGAGDPSPTPQDDPIVYVTRTGEKYHLGSCRYLSRSKIPMRLSEARRAYSPCSVCGPPR